MKDSWYLNLKKNIYKIIEKDENGDVWSLSFDILIITMAFLNVLIIVVASFYDTPGDKEMSSFMASTLRSIDFLVVITFSVEYILRLFISDVVYKGVSKRKAVWNTFLSPIGLLQLIALLPFYAELLNVEVSIVGIKSIRFLLLLKIGKYFTSFSLIGDVLKKKKSVLAAVIAIMMMVVVSASVFMYYIESEAQPEAFANIPATLWWGVVTLTTVGYGDIVPATVAGRILSSIVSIAGVGIVALPTGIISSGFLEELDLQSLDDEELFKKGPKAVMKLSKDDKIEKYKCSSCGSEMKIIKKGGK